MEKRTIEEITKYLDEKFPDPHFYLKRGNELFVIKGFKDRDELPIVDDGTIVGVKNSCLNFFPFGRRNQEKTPPEWLFNDYVEWLPGRTFSIGSDLDARLRKHYSNSFVHWLMKKYPDIEVHDNRGRKVNLPKKNVIIG